MEDAQQKRWPRAPADVTRHLGPWVGAAPPHRRHAGIKTESGAPGLQPHAILGRGAEQARPPAAPSLGFLVRLVGELGGGRGVSGMDLFKALQLILTYNLDGNITTQRDDPRGLFPALPLLPFPLFFF